MNPEILYEDNHLLAINKPAGLSTQPSLHNPCSLETFVKSFIQHRDHKPGNVFLHALHRLDKPASGIVLFAKTQKSLSRMSELFRTKNCVKIYTAIVEGTTPPQTGPITHYLQHGDHKAILCTHHDEGAKKAEMVISKVTPIHNNVWEVTIQLITGRYHQIRAQLSAMGYPIAGDTKYGGRTLYPNEANGTIALHHTELSFIHPIKGIPVTISSPPAMKRTDCPV